MVMSITEPKLEHIIAGLSRMKHTALNRTNKEYPLFWSLYFSVQGFYNRMPSNYKLKTSKYLSTHEKLYSPPSV